MRKGENKYNDGMSPALRHYHRNKERILAKRAAERMANPEKFAAQRAARKDKENARRCACCRRNLGESGYHIDHVVPLALGGMHDDSNLQLLCPSCNMSKHAKHPIDFMQSRGFLL